MKPLRVGMIEYINALPFYAAFKTGAIKTEASFVTGNPSTLNQLLREEQLDLALISSSEYLKHLEKYTLLPQFCIGAFPAVMSVVLYTNCPLYELDNQIIAVTSQSQTSVDLLRILAFYFWGVNPQFTPLPSLSRAQKFKAFLLIGDECLTHPQFEGYTRIDLCEAWYHATALPFTFAVFAATDKAHEQKSGEIGQFMQQVQQSLNWSRAHPETIHALAKAQSSLSEEKITAYYSYLQYTMNNKQRQALERFGSYTANLADKAPLVTAVHHHPHM